MNRPDDDSADMTFKRQAPELDERAIEALLTGRSGANEPLGRFLAALRSTAPTQGPPPRAELAQLLSHGFTPTPPAAPRRRGRVALGVTALIAGLAGSLTTAAAANALPGPAQRAVVDVVEALTPLRLPEPPRTGDSQPARPVTPEPTETASTAAQPAAAVPTDKAEPDGAVPEQQQSRERGNETAPVGAPESQPSTEATPAPEPAASREGSGEATTAPAPENSTSPVVESPTEASPTASPTGRSDAVEAPEG